LFWYDEVVMRKTKSSTQEIIRRFATLAILLIFLLIVLFGVFIRE